MIFVLKSRNVLMIFPDRLNVETFLTHQWCTQIQIFRHIYKYIYNMTSWEPVDPVDIDPIDHDVIGEEDDKWDDGKITEIDAKLEELRHFNTRLETSPDKDMEK